MIQGKSQNTLLLVSCVVLLCVAIFRYTTCSWNENIHVTSKTTQKYSMCGQEVLVIQRNNISRLLNLKQQQIGQMRCEIIGKNITFKEKTSDSGGWCPVATNTKHVGFDKKLAATLSEFFKGKTIGSFGDGPGKFKQAILATGLVKVYDAYDGAPFCENTSNGLVKFLDLSIPQFGLPVYDWILSLEVAEHIPTQFEDVFLDNVVRHAREGIVLSWAKPGQTGYSHVNNRDPEYVKECINKFGFQHDTPKTNSLRHGTNFGYLKRTMNVYIRKVTKHLSDLVCNA